MARPRQPTLRTHATGVFFVRWGARDHYFTRDPQESRDLFLSPDSDHPGSLARWMAWRASREALAARRLEVQSRLTIAEIYHRFDSELFAEGRLDVRDYYRVHLRRFIAGVGHVMGDEVDARLLLDFRNDLARIPDLKPRTVGHDLRAMKRLISWASASTRQLCTPINLNEIKPPRVPRPVPEPMTVDQIRRAIGIVRGTAPWLESWICFGYLTGCRPSEIIRVALGQGRLATIPAIGGQPAVRDGALELLEHKTSGRTGESRFILLSDEARVWYRGVQPMPSLRRSRSKEGAVSIRKLQKRACSLCVGAGVAGVLHRLRDSAAQHLLDLGEERGTVDLVLGHAPTGVLQSYGRVGLAILRASVSRLTLR